MANVIAFILLVFAFRTWALDETPAAVPEPPDIPPPVESGQNMQPDVTIVRKGKDIIEEYRINNRLYMIKVKPSIGPPYYMLDTDGDGNMDVRRSQLDEARQIPQWVLFSW